MITTSRSFSTMAADLHFPIATLSDEESQALVDQGYDEFTNLFPRIQTAMEKPSSPVHSNNKQRRWRCEPTSTNELMTICHKSHIDASLNEVGSVFFGPYINLCGVSQRGARPKLLHSLITPDDQYTMRACGVYWSMLDGMPTNISRPRDLVYIEYCDEFVDDHGRRGWARCFQSIDHRSCPSLEESHGIIRAEFDCCGVTYTECQDGSLEVVSFYAVDTKGSTPKWIQQIYASICNSNHQQHAVHLEHVVRLARSVASPPGVDDKIPSMWSHDDCYGCGGSLATFRRSRKCHVCKESLCKRCADIEYSGVQQLRVLTEICISCVDAFLGNSNERSVLYSESATRRSSMDLPSAKALDDARHVGSTRLSRLHVTTPKEGTIRHRSMSMSPSMLLQNARYTPPESRRKFDLRYLEDFRLSS